MSCAHQACRNMLQAFALLLLCASAVQSQQVSPLQGQGKANLATTDVYISFYLDRLLKVDDKAYTHQCVVYFYLTWLDPLAPKIVANSTAEAERTGRDCKKPCSNYMSDGACCDGLMLPSIVFTNVFSLPEDRTQTYEIVVVETDDPDINVVIWETSIHATFYQPMDFSHFPFDSFDLLIQFRAGAETEDNHPGVAFHFSSGGNKLFSLGRGDDTSEWYIRGVSFESKQYDGLGWYQKHSTIQADPGDPVPLNDPTRPTCTEQQIEQGECGSAQTVYAVKIRVERFSTWHTINSILPVVLCGILALLPLLLDLTDLTARLEITVTLFLALTAVQFVIIDRLPTSSYVIPTQQLALCTYVLLALVAIESILVFRISSWRQLRETAERRKEGYLRYKEAKNSANAQAGVLPTIVKPQLSSTAPGPAPAGSCSKDAAASQDSEASIEGAGPASETGVASGSAKLKGGSNANLPTTEAQQPEQEQGRGGQGTAFTKDIYERPGDRRPPSGGQGWLARVRGRTETLCKGPSGRKVRRSTKALVTTSAATFGHMRRDEDYAEYVGHLIDVWFGWFCFLGYILTITLCFTLNQGYVNLFDTQ